MTLTKSVSYITRRYQYSRLVEYDRSAFGYSRDAYLKKLLEIPDSEGWVA